MDKKHIRKQLAELRKYMRENRIKQTSCFNGGHSDESYRCNAELFRLKTRAGQLNQANRP